MPIIKPRDSTRYKGENKLSLISQKLRDIANILTEYMMKAQTILKILIIMTFGDLDGEKRINIIKVLGNQKIFPLLKQQLKTYMNLLIKELNLI